MHVRGLWRYPVKSMQGEVRSEVRLSAVGVMGDRSFGVLDVASGTIISAKRDGRLLEATARYRGQELLVGPPGLDELGPGTRLDNRLSQWLDRPVRLVPASGYGTPTFEGPDDFERDDSELHRWDGQIGSFVDESPLHVVTTGGLAELAAERARVAVGPSPLPPQCPGRRPARGPSARLCPDNGSWSARPSSKWKRAARVA